MATRTLGFELGVSVAFELLFIAILALWWLALLPKMMQRTWESIRRSLAWCSRACGQNEDEMDARIRKHMALKRLERLKLIAGPALYPIPLVVIWRLAVAVQFAFERGATLLDNSIVGLIFEGLAISFLSLFAVSWPRLADRVLTLPLLDAFMMLLFLAVGCHTIPASQSAQSYMSALNQSITVQMLLAMCLGNNFRVGLVNLANVILQLAVIYIPAFSRMPSTGDLVDGCVDYEVNMYWRLLWNALFTQLVAVMATQVQRAEAQAIIGEMEASRSQTTAVDLLSVMCDAVVALRKDFTFRGNCSRLLACLMMRERMPTSDASPTSFLKYVSQEGQERFKELIATQEGAGTFHLHLVDSLHRKVPVQVFHTKWIDADNEVNYLLGIQEDGEVDHYPSATSLPELEKRRAPDQRTATETPSPRSEASGSRKSSVSGVSGWNSAGVTCLLRVGLNMEIMNQSDECKVLFGFADNILSHFDPRCQTRFADWLTRLHLQKTDDLSDSFGVVDVHSSTGIRYKAMLDASVLEVSPLDTLLELSITAPNIRKPPTEQQLLHAAARRSPEQRRRLQARAARHPAVRRILQQSTSVYL